MNRERLKVVLERIKDSDLDIVNWTMKSILGDLINALLEDDKPKTATEVVMKEEAEKEIERLIRWTPEESKAIKESIIHWRDNVSRLKLAGELGFSIKTDVCTWYIVKDFSRGIIGYCDVDHCSLCRLSYSSSSSSFCHNCPLAIKNVRCQTTDSPWYRCKNAQGNQEIILSAENMVSVLESLLE